MNTLSVTQWPAIVLNAEKSTFDEYDLFPGLRSTYVQGQLLLFPKMTEGTPNKLTLRGVTFSSLAKFFCHENERLKNLLLNVQETQNPIAVVGRLNINSGKSFIRVTGAISPTGLVLGQENPGIQIVSGPATGRRIDRTSGRRVSHLITDNLEEYQKLVKE